MKFQPKTIAIMYRPGNPEAVKTGQELAKWLLDKGYSVLATPGQKLTTAGRSKKIPSVGKTNLTKIDWVIVLGGDGTYLRAVRMLQGRQVPILGVNMGSLGFLTETPVSEMYKVINMTLQNKMEVRTRSMLKITLRRGRKVRGEFFALNDAVLERGSSTHLINIGIYSDKHLVGQIKADALIIASPTGSTAYNLAAGGPILHPDVRAIVCTPVCPHALTSRPLIFPDDQDLSFKVLAKNTPSVLTIDGVNCGEMTPDDEVVVVRAPLDHLIIRKPDSNYFNILREKLSFGKRD